MHDGSSSALMPSGLADWLQVNKLEALEVLDGSVGLHLRVRRQDPGSGTGANVAAKAKRPPPIGRLHHVVASSAKAAKPSNRKGGAHNIGRRASMGSPQSTCRTQSSFRSQPSSSTCRTMSSCRSQPSVSTQSSSRGTKGKGGHRGQPFAPVPSIPQLPSLKEEQQQAIAEAAALEKRIAEKEHTERVARALVRLDPDLKEAEEFAAEACALREGIDAPRRALELELQSVDMVVGLGMIESEVKANAIIRAWDKKFKGSISRVEFRKEVKESLGVHASMQALDVLFDQFDADGGGTLDEDELKAMLAKIRRQALDVSRRRESLLASQSDTLARIERLDAIVEATQAALAAHAAEDDRARELELVALRLQRELRIDDEVAKRRREEERSRAEAARKAREAEEEAVRLKAIAAEKARAEEDRRQAELEATTLEKSETLMAMLKALRVTIKELLPSNDGAIETVQQKLGKVLVQRFVKPAELCKEFDRDNSGDVSKIEFRQSVRSLGLKEDNNVVDALFTRLDMDGGGTLDAEELRVALKLFRDAAAEAMDAAEMRASKLARLQPFLAQMEKAHTVTLEAESAMAEYVSMREDGTADEAEMTRLRLYANETKQNAKVAQFELSVAEKTQSHADALERRQAGLRAEEKEAEEARELARAAEAAKLQAEVKRRKKEEAQKRVEQKRHSFFSLIGMGMSSS